MNDDAEKLSQGAMMYAKVTSYDHPILPDDELQADPTPILKSTAYSRAMMNKLHEQGAPYFVRIIPVSGYR
jgi:hypothetical protein